MQGVYQIKNIISGNKYIGSSEDIKRRWDAHKANLNGDYHKNPHLQNAWNKYGKDKFIFMLLEGTENLMEREQHYLDNVVEWGYDYNICPYVTNGMKGRKHTKEAKRKIGEAHKGRTLSEEHIRKLSESHKGNTLSEETKRKLSEAKRGELHHNAKLTYEQVWQIHTLYATGNYTQAQLGRRLGVSRSNIGRIVRGVCWPHVHDKFQRRKP